MAERNATIASRVGLHARPAGLFIEAVNKQPVAVTISKDGSAPMNAASILSIMSLGAAHGDIVTLAAEGDSAEQALERLVALLHGSRRGVVTRFGAARDNAAVVRHVKQ